MSAVSVAEAKQFLQIGYDNQDLILQILIDSAQQFVEEKTGFKLDGASERIDLVDGGVFTLFPESFPVVSVSEVLDVRSSSVVSADLYRLANDGLQLKSGTRWVSGGHFETADRVGDNQQRFQITYVGGYATPPARFKELIQTEPPDIPMKIIVVCIECLATYCMVIIIPKNAKNPSNRFFALPLSAIAPRIGAMAATRIAAIELAVPR